MRPRAFAFAALLASSSLVAACGFEDWLDPDKDDEEGTPTPGNSPTPTPTPAATPVVTTVGDVTTFDWGTIALDAGESPRFRFTAPSGTIGIDFLAIGAAGDQDKIFGFFNVIAPGNRTVIDNSGGAPARQAFAFGAMSFAVPSDDSATTAAAPGDWEFAIFAADDTDFVATNPRVMAKVRTAAGGTVPDGEIPMNVVIVEGLGFDAATACTPGSEVYDALAHANSLYAANLGLQIGNVTCYDLSNSTAFTDVGSIDEMRDLFETSAGLADEVVNLYVVNSLSGELSNAAGVAGSVPIPMQVNGTRNSGVVVSLQGNALLLGKTIAHEVGHSLGLYHTTEFDAATNGFDLISDTAQCPGLGTSYPGSGCPDEVNVMFPQLDDDMAGFSAGQGEVILPTVHVAAAGTAFAPPAWTLPPPGRWPDDGRVLRCIDGIVREAE